MAIARTTMAGQIALWLIAGCAKVQDGAVELSWQLRPSSGASSTDPFVHCTSGFVGTGAVTQIRLVWDVGGTEGTREWRCDDSHGVTGFEVPTPSALLRVLPICDNDQPAASNTYTAPAPEQRAVIAGDTVSLGAVEIVVQVSSCDQQPCICQ